LNNDRTTFNIGDESQKPYGLETEYGFIA